MEAVGETSSRRDIQLSKRLSWLLRHGALIEGFQISTEGFIQVDKVLQFRDIKGKYSLSDIERIVTDNDKKRFTLRQNPITNVLEIKANQGHTIAEVSDDHLTPILEPKYKTVVHGTYLRNWRTIKEQGLYRMKRHHIHFAKGLLNDDSVISGLRKSAEIYIFIDLARALLDGIKFYESENGVILTRGNTDGYLIPKYFSKVVNAKTGESAILMDSTQGLTMDMGVPIMRVPTQHGAPSKGPPFKKQNAALNTQSITTNAPQNSISDVSNTAQNADNAVQNTLQNSASGVSKRSRRRAKKVSQNSETLSRNVERNQVDREVLPSNQQNNEAGNQANRSHRNRKPRWRDNRKKQKDELNNNCKVTVTGYPDYTQPEDFEHLFSQFGTVKVQGKNIEAAILEFSNEAEAQKAIESSKKIALYAEILTVRPYSESDPKHHTQKRSFMRSQQKSVIVAPSSLDLSGDFLQQLDAVLGAVRLSLQEVTTLGQLYTDLENALQAQWPGCKAIPFGSIPTGLGIKTSDADCFMLIPDQFRHQHNIFVNKTRRLLQMYPSIFAEILAIPRANTPIVKFFHIPTETNCDVSFKTPLGTRNTALVFFLLSADPRLIPIAVLIKYWAKVHRLSGTGKLTNYALTMLIVFYLQQPPLSVLPSVEWLQRNPETSNIVDHWNTGFTSKHENLPRSTNTSAISELIGGFFQYYSTFNFADLVVCPYLGTPIPKTAFKNLQNLPPEFERYKQNLVDHLAPPLRFLTSMVIQDPFEQCHNVASSVTTLMSEKIKAYIDFAANAYEAEKLNNCEKFLHKILLEKPAFVEKKPPPEYKIKFPCKMINPHGEPDWKVIVKDVVFDVFEKICKLKLTLQEKDTDTHIPHPRETKKVKQKYLTTITKPFWKNRKDFSGVCNNDQLGIVEKQTRITEEIIQAELSNINLEVCVSIYYYSSSKNASLNIKLLEGEVETYKEFGRFFIVSIQGWFKELFKPFGKKQAEIPSIKPQLGQQNKDNVEEATPADTDDDEALDESQVRNDEQSGSNDIAQDIDSDDNSDS